MRKHFRLIAVLAAFALLLAACGRSADAPTREGLDYNKAPSADVSLADEGYTGEAKYGSLTSADASNKEASGIHSNTKVIRTAELSLQSTEFEKTCEMIERLAAENGGYLEKAQLSNGSLGYSGASYKTASYTVRVPAEKYESFLSGINESCHVVSLSRSAQDVGEDYFITEQKLETLNNKHERLEALLKEASTMTDIISLESALSDCEYEINLLTGKLERYDSLVGYSTINISLREVARTDSAAGVTPSFGERLGRSLSEGFERFVSGAQDLLLWLGGNILTLALLVIIVVVIVKLHPVRRIKKGFAAKNAAKDAPLSAAENAEETAGKQ